MPTSAPGNSLRDLSRHVGAGPRGFTLLELMIVVAIIALASGVVSLALRDPAATRLAREGQRLAALLEAGRAQSRALGIPVQWRVVPPLPGTAPGAQSPDFRFDGVPEGTDLPQRWLHDGDGAVTVELRPGQFAVLLGPEPAIGAQRLVLHLGDQRIVLATDGLGPFLVVDE